MSEPKRLLPGKAQEITPQEQMAPIQRHRMGYTDAHESDVADRPGPAGFLEYWYILRRNKGYVAIAGVLGAIIGLLISLPQTPIYQARASIEIQGINENFMNIRDVSPTSSPNAHQSSGVSTHVTILQSLSLIDRVAQKLSIEKVLDGEPDTGRISAWRNALDLPAPTPQSARQRAFAFASANLRVRPLRDTAVVEITADSTDPGVAAEFVNTLIQEYVDLSLESRWEATQHTGEWLSKQLEDLRITLEKSEEKLQRYARASGLMFTSEQGSVAEERLRQMQSQLSEVQADRIAKQSRYELAKTSAPDSLPEVLDAPHLAQYEVKLTDLRRQLADITSTFTPAHPRARRVQAQIDELEVTAHRERSKILERIRNEYESALSREKLIDKAYLTQSNLVSEQSERSIQYNILNKEVETNRQLYDHLLQKVKEAGVAAAMNASNIRVVDPAKPPKQPYRPRHSMNSLRGLFGGIFLGIVFVLVRERVDRALKKPGDAAFYLDLPELGVIPGTSAGTLSSGSPSRRGRRSVSLTLRIKNNANNGTDTMSLQPTEKQLTDSVELTCWLKKPSLQAECFRSVLTSILFTGCNGDRPQILVVTSPLPGEGKTTVASNIAITLAEINKRVLLIDADLRKPRLHDIFDLPNTWGLTDLLQSGDPIERSFPEVVARETKIPNLHILPSGPRTQGISTLLHSARTIELIHRVRQEFDMVVIDTPPMTHLADARILGQLVGDVVLVLRAGRTSRDSARASADQFREDGTRVVGTILNDWSPNASGNGYYDGYYRPYQQYYAEDSTRS